MVLHLLRGIVAHHDPARHGTRAAHYRLCAAHPFHSSHAHLLSPSWKAERTFRGHSGVFQNLTIGELLPGCPTLLRSPLDGRDQLHYCGLTILVVSTANRTRHCTTSICLIAGIPEWATETTIFCIACPPTARVSLGLDEHVDRFNTQRSPTVSLSAATSPATFI